MNSRAVFIPRARPRRRDMQRSSVAWGQDSAPRLLLLALAFAAFTFGLYALWAA
jgi:hypothetical protein